MVIGPTMGAVLSERASWRWIFGINLPLSAIAILLVVYYLNLPMPKGSMAEKWKRIDWMYVWISVMGQYKVMLTLILSQRELADHDGVYAFYRRVVLGWC